MREVLFHRDLRAFSGGHLKVWHYFGHVLNAPQHRPWVRFSRASVWNEANPWRQSREHVLRPGVRVDPDILFVGGLDWLALGRGGRAARRRPVINLVQHVRHGDPADARYRFLPRRAVRICVSAEVADAIVATGRVNGPVFTIPNGVDVGTLGDGPVPPARDIDVLVVANKRPDMGWRLRDRLGHPGRTLHLVDATIPRPTFLSLLCRARVSVFVPGRTEGFYLPALEGMALGTVVVCADCVGNRSFCQPGDNCFRPDPEEDDLVHDAEEALALSPAARDRLLDAGRATAAAHDLAGERAAFHRILHDLDRLWEAG